MWATVCPGRERPTLGPIGQGKKEHPSQFQSFTVDLPSADPPVCVPVGAGPSAEREER